MLQQFCKVCSAVATATCSVFSLKFLLGVTDRDLAQIGLYHLKILPQQIPHVLSEMELEWPPPHNMAYCFSSAFPLKCRHSFWWMMSWPAWISSWEGGIWFEWMTLGNTIYIVLRVWYSLWHTTVPIQPCITCLCALNSWCHRRAVSRFTSVMDGFDTHHAHVKQLCYEAISGGENCSLILSKMPAKSSCTLQIYGHIYILGITTKAAWIPQWMSANCCTQHSLL